MGPVGLRELLRVHALDAAETRSPERVERQRGEPAPPVDALAVAGRPEPVGVGDRGVGVEPLEPFAVLPVGPLGVGAVGDVHVVLEQLAVADVNRLGDHVGVGVLRDPRVEQPGVVLPVDVLLDRAARSPDADRVARHAVALDELLLGHQRRLAAQHEVVVDAGPGPARVDDRVALAQPVVVEGASARGPLPVSDPDPAVEGVDGALVPKRGVGLVARALAEGRQHRERVDEAVDRPALAAHHVVHLAPVHGRRRHVGGPRSVRGKRPELAAGSAVEVVDRRLGRAVEAPSGRAAVRVQHPEPLARLVVDQRLAEPRLDRLAHERALVGAGEDRPGDGVVDEREAILRRRRRAAVGHDGERVLAQLEPGDQPHQCPVVALEGVGDVVAVALHAQLVEQAARRVDPHQGVAPAHHVGIARQHLEMNRLGVRRRGRRNRGHQRHDANHPASGNRSDLLLPPVREMYRAGARSWRGASAQGSGGRGPLQAPGAGGRLGGMLEGLGLGGTTEVWCRRT